MWWTRSNAKDIQPIPWLGPNVTARLDALLNKDMTVLEFGSGGSSLWMAARVKSVSSVENNPDWRDAVKRAAPDNVVLLTEIPAGKFDIILIDGEPVEQRADWLKFALEKVNPGGIIVLDNANRPEYAAERDAMLRACQHVTIDENQPGTKYLVTDFYTVAL